MNSRKNNQLNLLVIVVLILGLFASCAHKKAYKKALEYEKAGRYVEAAEQDLRALEPKDPRNPPVGDACLGPTVSSRDPGQPGAGSGSEGSLGVLPGGRGRGRGLPGVPGPSLCP